MVLGINSTSNAGSNFHEANILTLVLLFMRHSVFVYIIAWSAVVLGINSTSNAGSNFHEAKPSEISCITSAINP